MNDNSVGPTAPPRESQDKPNQSTFQLESFKGKKPHKQHWLWPNIIPENGLTVIFGRPEVGKTTIAANIAAVLSKGSPWPVTGEDAPSRGVLILEGEDDENRLLSLLMAHDADLSNIMTLKAANNSLEVFSIVDHIHLLERLFQSRPDIRALILSPITLFIGVKDENSGAQLRKALAPLYSLMHRYKISIIGLAHPRKGSDGHMQDSLAGTHVWMAAARSVILALENPQDPDGPRYIGVCKSNAASKKLTFTYSISGTTIEGESGETIETSRVIWNDSPVAESIRSIYEKSGNLTARFDMISVAEWLSEYLSDGPKKSKDVVLAASEEGLKVGASALFKSLKKLGGRTYKDKSSFASEWIWSLS